MWFTELNHLSTSQKNNSRSHNNVHCCLKFSLFWQNSKLINYLAIIADLTSVERSTETKMYLVCYLANQVSFMIHQIIMNQ